MRPATGSLVLALLGASAGVTACSDANTAAGPPPIESRDAGEGFDASTTSGDAASATSSSDGGGAAKLDYGYRENTALVFLEYEIGRTDSIFGVEFVKSHTADAFMRSSRGDCIDISSLSPDGGKTTDTTVYALPGTVTVSGSGDTPYKQSFTPSASNVFEPGLNPNGHYFLGGEDVVFSSSGAEVPSFENHLQFPLVLRLTEPSASTGTVRIPRDRDLSLSWTRGAPSVDLYFDAFAGTHGVACRFDSTTGHATIPRDLLAAFPSKTQARLFTLAYARAKIGAFDTEFDISTTVFFPLPDQHAVSAEFE